MSERIARRAAQQAALGVTDTRGARFAQTRTGTKGPDFADMAAVPRWLMLEPDKQTRVAHAVGLLQHRTSINRELSGQRLAMLADEVGEDLLDAICSGDAGDGATNATALPRPNLIAGEGWVVMQRGLPMVFAVRFSDAASDPVARALSEQAVDLVLAL